MAHIELVVAQCEEFVSLVENVVMNALDRKERIMVIGDPVLISKAEMLISGPRGLPQHVEMEGLEPQIMRSTEPEHLRCRDMLLAASRRPSRLVAIVPPLRGPASICPLAATARCAKAGATFLATPEVAATIPMHLLNPEKRIAA